MKTTRGILGEIESLYQAADRATGPWIALSAAFAAAMALLEAYSTAIVALFGLLVLDTVVGAWRYWAIERRKFSVKLLFSRAFEKVAAMVLITAAALLFALIAPGTQHLAVGGALMAFGLKELASVVYNVHQIRPALVPQSVLDWVTKLYKASSHDDNTGAQTPTDAAPQDPD